MPLTVERVRQLFSYDSKYGILVRMEYGDTIDGPQVTIDGHAYPTANVVWLHHYGVSPSKILDHKNRRRRDISIHNLREASYNQNGYNQWKYNPNGLKGVYNCGRKIKPWQAQIRINGKKVNLGRFETKEEAHAAYRKAAKEHFGEFAYYDC